jgi:putative membrane protein
MPALILLLLVPTPALAHGGGLDEGSAAAAALLAFWAVVYAFGARRGRGAVGRRAVLLFTAGWLLLAGTTLSPLHAMGRASFAWHMIEHMAIMLAAAPLLVLGRPLVALLWAVPRAARGAVGRLAGLGRPLAASLLYAAALWGWHAPPLFDAAVRSEALHLLQHALMLTGSMAWWWSLVHAAAGSAVLSIFVASVHAGILGALLTVSARPWFGSYPDLEDQQLAGLVMWIPAASIHVAAALALLARWLRQAELGARRWEARL